MGSGVVVVVVVGLGGGVLAGGGRVSTGGCSILYDGKRLVRNDCGGAGTENRKETIKYTVAFYLEAAL